MVSFEQCWPNPSFERSRCYVQRTIITFTAGNEKGEIVKDNILRFPKTIHPFVHLLSVRVIQFGLYVSCWYTAVVPNLWDANRKWDVILVLMLSFKLKNFSQVFDCSDQVALTLTKQLLSLNSLKSKIRVFCGQSRLKKFKGPGWNFFCAPVKNIKTNIFL